MTVKQLVSDAPSWIFIGQFKRFRPEPMDGDNRNERVGQNASDRCIRLEVFESNHAYLSKPKGEFCGLYAMFRFRDNLSCLLAASALSSPSTFQQSGSRSRKTLVG